MTTLAGIAAGIGLSTLALASCGGGGGDAPTSPTGPTYPFVTPAVASQRTYAQILVDNTSNTINESYTDTVLATNADGSFVVQHRDPANTSVTVNGTTYFVTPETVTVDASGPR